MIAQPLTALAVGNERRRVQVRVRRGLRDRTLSLTGVLLDPPAELSDVLVLDVVRWARSASGQRGAAGMHRLGRLALRDGVNLLVPVGRASVATRAWAAQHGGWQLKRGRAA